MERYAMNMAKKTQYCPDVSSFQIDLDSMQFQSPSTLFVVIDRLILKLKWKDKRQNSQHNMKNKVGGLTFPSFKTYYKARVLNRVYYYKNKSIRQNRETRNRSVQI